MKKYISILGLVTAWVLQSCERNGTDFTESEDHIPTALIQEKASGNEVNGVPDVPDVSGFKDTGDDDPPKDKQHWKVVNDTLR